MPILETLRRNPDLPNIDIVVAANDEPRVPSIYGDQRSWERTCKRYPGEANGGMPEANGRMQQEAEPQQCAPRIGTAQRKCASPPTASRSAAA